MLNETIREVHDFLADATVGLGAMLAVLPRDGGDPLPSTPTIVNETTSFAVALNRPPATLPALTIALDTVLDLDPNAAQRTRDASVALWLKYVVKTVAANTGTRDAYYVMRALERSLDRWTTARARNGVEIYAVTERAYGTPMQELEDSWIVCGLRVVFQVRDTTT